MRPLYAIGKSIYSVVNHRCAELSGRAFFDFEAAVGFRGQFDDPDHSARSSAVQQHGF
jgi:hypothetical protein